MISKKSIVLATVLTAIVAFVVGTSAYSLKAEPVVDTSKGSLIRDHAHIFGPDSASVTITEFFDPSCEACRAFYPHVKAILAKYPTQVRLVLRYAAFHKGSAEAVGILEAAHQQGKYLPVLEAMLETQPKWASHGAPDLEAAWQAAGAVGLDLNRARADAKATYINTIVQQDMFDAGMLDVQYTPTFFIDGKKLDRPSPDSLIDAVDAAVLSSVDP